MRKHLLLWRSYWHVAAFQLLCGHLLDPSSSEDPNDTTASQRKRPY